MADLPINFRSDRDRLLRLVEADRGMTVEERIRAIGDMWEVAEVLRIADGSQVECDRRRQIREGEFREWFRELKRRYLEGLGQSGAAVDQGRHRAE